MTPKRKTRPKLERDRPVRTWSTLFGPAGEPKPSVENGESSSAASAGSNASSTTTTGAVSDTVDVGYRVIDEYLRQGQQVAQAFNPSAWMGTPGRPEDMAQMAQRVMQYGWDFAGMWFELWSKMAASTGTWPPPPPPSPAGPAESGKPASRAAASATAAASAATSASEASSGPERVVVSISSARPTTTALELRPGPLAALIVHSLRPEGHDGAPIRDVSIERDEQDGSMTVRVNVAASQAPGTYNAMIVDAATNRPRGTLSVTISEPEG